MRTLCLTLLILATSATVQADEGIEDGLNRLAIQVSEYLKKENRGQQILVGDFVAPPRLKASGGPGLSLLLQQALKRHSVETGEKAPFQLVGQFTVREEKAVTSDKFESLALRLTASILDRDDEEQQKISISIHGDSALQFSGGNAELPTNKDEAERQEAAREAINKPHAAIVANETRGSDASPFGVEVRARRGTGRDSEARTPKAVDGRSFVELTKGEEYVVRLHNRAPFEAAVTLTIDGLNMFAFSDEGNFGSQVLIPPGKVVDIPGWYINKQKSDAFEITNYAKSAAASRGVVNGIGTITASFSAAWDPSANPPADEASPKSADTATGRGRQIEQRYEQVKRVVGRVRSVVSVRYAK